MRRSDSIDGVAVGIAIVLLEIPISIGGWLVTSYPVLAVCIGAAVVSALAHNILAFHRANPARTLAGHQDTQTQELPSQAAAQGHALASRRATALASWHRNMLTLSESIINEHAAELAIRRRQLTSTSNYGLVDQSKWLQEVEFFIDEIIEESCGHVGNSPQRLQEVRVMIEQATANYSASRIGFSSDMDPVDFEQMVADALADLGWETRLTKGSGDQGIDVIAEMREKRVVIQCKRYASAIGNSAVQEAYAGKSFENADYAVVVSNAKFTPGARQLAETTRVILLHHDELAQLEGRIFGATTMAQSARANGHNTSPYNTFAEPSQVSIDTTPIAYVQAVADGLNSLGWQARFTETGEDHHADVIAEMRGKRVMVQCTGFVSPIGIVAVQDLFEAKTIEGADYAAIVSNAEFTPNAHQLA
jgi:restriction system protein